MSLFFLTIFTIYGGMHVYAFVRARSVLGFGPGWGAAFALFLVLMTAAPFLVRALELHGYEFAARVLSYVAYIWMALLFLFFCGSVVVDLVNLVGRIAVWLTRSGISAPLVPPKTSFFVNLALAVAICGYGYFEALDIRAERVRIETEKLPAGIDRLTIAQISDVHLGLIVRRARLEKMLDIVKAAKPDLFISTGDLVDAQINHLNGLAELLRGLQARLGNYAITGNHEYYAGLEQALAFTKEAGFTILRNEAVNAGPISIAGFDDPTGVQMKLQEPVPEKDILAKIPRNKFTLLLKHQPRIDRPSVGLFDLQLSGHAHKGQIFPFTLVTRIIFPLNAGDYDLGKGSLLHVSRGSGTWGPPVRFLAPPEVTIIELVRKH